MRILFTQFPVETYNNISYLSYFFNHIHEKLAVILQLNSREPDLVFKPIRYPACFVLAPYLPVSLNADNLLEKRCLFKP